MLSNRGAILAGHSPARRAMGRPAMEQRRPMPPAPMPSTADPVLKPFNQLQPPKITLTQIGDDQAAADLLRQAGLL